ncbi:MAG: hypothetical protein FJ086_06530 [Deltaproteobacteria bacterium]|nr:hypothetical protein [Deltaproteobacteria bacterium]
MSLTGARGWSWAGGAVSAAGAALCLWLGGAGRWTALAGVLCAAATFAFAVFMKGWAVRKHMDAAMLTLMATFGLRLLVAGSGVLACSAFGQATAFVVGFFGAFVPLQVLEMGFVLAAHGAAKAQGSVT